MRYRIKVLSGLFLLVIPFCFGFMFIPMASCGEMEITISIRLIAGFLCEVFAIVSTVLLVAGVILAFDDTISAKLRKINGGYNVYLRR